MSFPIIPSKFGLPVLPGTYLARERLDRLCDIWKQKRLIQVTAGGGFGKSSFLAANARAAKRICLWYTLDEIDSNLQAFCTHLIEAIRSASPILTGTKHRRLSQRPDASDPEYANHTLSYLLRMINESDQPWLIVFDDLHRASEYESTLHFLERLIKFVPDGTTVILASREPVSIATMKTRTDGGYATLSTRELRFTWQETAALFQKHYPKVSLPSHLSRKIVARTEGWAAGIEIFLQGLRNPTPRAIEQSLAGLTETNLSWFDYFAEEVINRLSPKQRDFLLRSAILPRLVPALCDDLLGIDDSDQILRELCARNLFTFPVEDSGKIFKYHQLFHEFLRNRLRDSLGRDGWRKLQNKAAKTLARTGDYAEAVGAYAASGDPDAAVRLTGKLGRKLTATGQYEVIHKALNTVPPKQIALNAKATLVLGHVNEVLGHWREAEAIYRRALKASVAGTDRIELMSLIAQLQMRRGRYRSCINLCHRALAEKGRMRPAIRGSILSALGICESALGRLGTGEKHLMDAAAVYLRSGDEAGEGRTQYLLASNIYYQQGAFQTAKDAARHAVVVFRHLGERRRLCVSLGVLGFIMVHQGDEREARDLSEDALRLAESLEYPIIEGYCHDTLGRCALLRSDTIVAGDHFRTCLDIGELLGEVSLRIFAHQGFSQIAFADSDYHGAKHHALAAAKIAHDVNELFQEGICLKLLGLAEVHLKSRLATEHWRQAEKLFKRIGARYETHHLLLLMLSARKIPTARQKEALTELITGAAAAGHGFLFSDIEPQRAAQVLSQALCHEIEPDYISRLLAGLGPIVCDHLAPLARSQSDTIRAASVGILAQIGGTRAQDILTEIAGAATAKRPSAKQAAEELERVPHLPLRIQALGPLSIACGDNTLTAASWRSKRALRLLQLLLVHRFRWIPRDILLEALWPDGEPEKSGNNLWQSVHQLRKMIEPDLLEARNSRYIRFHNGACRLEPGDGYYYDVEEFETTITEAGKLLSGKKRSQATPLLRQAIDGYHGDFIAENPYEDFLTEERESQRDNLLRAIQQLLELSESARRWDEIIPLCRRALVLDSYREEFYRFLIQAQLKLGARHEALTDYHRYEEMMIRELDLLPSARMKQLADQAASLS